MFDIFVVYIIYFYYLLLVVANHCFSFVFLFIQVAPELISYECEFKKKYLYDNEYTCNKYARQKDNVTFC